MLCAGHRERETERFPTRSKDAIGRFAVGLAGVGGEQLGELDLALVFRAFLVAFGIAQA